MRNSASRPCWPLRLGIRPPPRTVVVENKADNQDRDVELWTCTTGLRRSSCRRGGAHVLVARGRAQVGVHSAKTDWSRRILDFQYMDYDDQAAHIE